MFFQKTLAALALTTLAACGGSGGGGQFGASSDAIFNGLLDLQASAIDWTPTADANVNGASGSATYDGFVNVGGTSGGDPVGYLGQMSTTVDFSADTLSGSAGNFYRYDETTITPTSTNPLGPSVSGSLRFSGDLTGVNETGGVGGGILGTYSGNVDGIRETGGELGGMIMGSSREGILLYFNGDNMIGVGIGAD